MSEFDFLTPEFVADCNRCGIACHLDMFPWKYLDVTDDEFMAIKMNFIGGYVVPKEYQRKLLGVIRAQERLLKKRFLFVQKRNKTKIPTGEQLEMF